MGENRDVAGVLTKGVAPALGMAMVWPLLRYASFFMLLYPVGLEVPLGARGLTAHGAFLATLAVAAVMALALWCGANGVFRRRRLAAALGTLASVGALLAFGVKGAVLPPWALWVSIAATAVGFLALYLAWGSYMAGLMAGGEYPRAVALLGLSFALSFVLFSRAGLVGSLAGGRAAAVAMPLGAAALWLCSRPAVPLVVDGERFVPCRAVTPLLTAVGMFLVVGSAVRGIVDLQSHGTPGRQFSMEASLLVAAVSVAVAARCRRGRSAERVVRAESDVVALSGRGLLDGVCPAVPGWPFRLFGHRPQAGGWRRGGCEPYSYGGRLLAAAVPHGGRAPGTGGAPVFGVWRLGRGGLVDGELRAHPGLGEHSCHKCDAWGQLVCAGGGPGRGGGRLGGNGGALGVRAIGDGGGRRPICLGRHHGACACPWWCQGRWQCGCQRRDRRWGAVGCSAGPGR